jgi:hypothetical protein
MLGIVEGLKTTLLAKLYSVFPNLDDQSEIILGNPLNPVNLDHRYPTGRECPFPSGPPT